MKMPLPLSVALLCCSFGTVAATPAINVQPGLVHAAATQSPFACDTLALEPVARKRHFDVLGPELVSKRLAVEELPDGYEFTLPNDKVTYDHVAEWANGERLCCPFFDISLRATPEHGPLKLRITGRPGTKAFMQADGAAWVKPVLASR
jgi:hypothetical protein